MILLDFENKDYPRLLKKIKKPPKQIWVEGNLEILNQNAIAVIGSRNMTEYGKKWCEIFTKKLLEYGLVIVSGMANGIDSIAHKTALNYGGKTIAVLPSGFKNIYPKQNCEIFENIIKNGGAVISEYSPEIKADKEKFLERNRIVSGLAIGTLVIEAEYRSGTSVTAKITREDGKNVFCIPGSLDNSKSIGTNNMIKKGATLVTNINDIVSKYSFLHKVKTLDEQIRNYDYEISKEFEEIYKILLKEPMNISKLIRLSNLSINEIMEKISMLEIEGKIRKERNGNICIINKK